MLGELSGFGLELEEVTEQVTMCSLVARPTLVDRVLEAQSEDVESEEIRERVISGIASDGWEYSIDWGLRYRGGMFVPQSCRDDVLRESHHS